MVPHYRLRDLHALLNQVDDYRDEAPIVDGYFFPRDPGDGGPAGPTVLDVMACSGRPA